MEQWSEKTLVLVEGGRSHVSQVNNNEHAFAVYINLMLDKKQN